MRQAVKRQTALCPLLRANLPVTRLQGQSTTTLSAMTIKTIDSIARKLAKIAAAQQQCAEHLADLANQLTTSTEPKAPPPTRDRRNDRHSQGYMREYMRRWREAK